MCEPRGVCPLQAGAEKSLWCNSLTVQSQVGFSLVFQCLSPVFVQAIGGLCQVKRILEVESEVRELLTLSSGLVLGFSSYVNLSD